MMCANHDELVKSQIWDGNVMSVVFGGAIHVMDTGTGELLETLDDKADVDGPNDVELAPNGDIYYTDILLRSDFPCRKWLDIVKKICRNG